MTLDSPFCETRKRWPVITVRQKLLELGARWDQGVLRDASGKQIYFFQVPEYGPPLPTKEMAWREKRFAELPVLKRRYNVVVMYGTRAPV